MTVRTYQCGCACLSEPGAGGEDVLMVCPHAGSRSRFAAAARKNSVGRLQCRSASHHLLRSCLTCDPGLCDMGTLDRKHICGRQKRAHWLMLCAVQMDDAMGTAQAVASSLADQRQTFDNIGGKLMTIGSKFPIVNGLLNAIRRKKNRVRAVYSAVLPAADSPQHELITCPDEHMCNVQDTLVLSSVIAVCTLFTLTYWWSK